jgi:hypothetical protein
MFVHGARFAAMGIGTARSRAFAAAKSAGSTFTISLAAPAKYSFRKRCLVKKRHAGQTHHSIVWDMTMLTIIAELTIRIATTLAMTFSIHLTNANP